MGSGMLMSSELAEWQIESDRRRAETVAHYERQRIMQRAAHISTVAAAFSGAPFHRDDAIELAACAVDALIADGVVFVSLGPCHSTDEIEE